MRSDRFEWDDNKAASNLLKHGIAFEEAQEIFDDPQQISIHDPDHSQDEERYLTLGTALFDMVLVVAHTKRDERIRIISARRANRAERRIYMSNNNWMINDKPNEDDTMRPDYDFRFGERAKFLQKRDRTVVRVSVDSEVARHFATDEELNNALRKVIEEEKATALRRK